MTQKELGKQIGVSFQGIAQWENDLRNPKYETLQRIAEALGTTADDLKGRERPMDMEDNRYRVREILNRQLERLDEASDRLSVKPEHLAQIAHAMCAIADRLIDPPPISGNRAERREDDKAAEAVTPAASANPNNTNMLVFNRADGKKLVIRRSRDLDEPGEQDTVMVEIFDEDMGNDFSPELEMGHGASMTAHVFTEAIRKVVDAPETTPAAERNTNWAALLLPEGCHSIFVCMDGELFDTGVESGMVPLHDGRRDASVPCFIAGSPVSDPKHLGIVAANCGATSDESQ